MDASIHYDAFVSYSTKDKNFVKSFVSRLVDSGIKVTWDEDFEVGAFIPLAIENAIKSSRCLVLVMSANSVGQQGSQWVSLEQEMAMFRDPTNKNRGLIPVLIDDVKLPERLVVFKYVDLRHSCGELETNYEKIVHAILRLRSFREPNVKGMPVAGFLSNRIVEVTPDEKYPADLQYTTLLKTPWILGFSIVRCVLLTVTPSLTMCLIATGVYFSPFIGLVRGVWILMAAAMAVLCMQGVFWSIIIRRKMPLRRHWWIEPVVSMAFTSLAAAISLGILAL